MNRKPMQRPKVLGEFLLYSFMACVSYLLLVRFTDIPVAKQDKVFQLQVILAFGILFNGVGFSIRYITERLKFSSRAFANDRKWFLLSIAVTALSLIIINYGLLVLVKWFIGFPEPFRIAYTGIRGLLLAWLIELIIISLSLSRHFYKDLARLYQRAKNLEESNLQARYMALQNQLNPHFLFNSLNVLISEIEYNPKNAVIFTRNLSDTYRYILLSQDKKLVSLQDEITFLNTYMQLHRTRLGECIHIRICFSLSEQQAWRLPPLTLQLLAENVIKHNIISTGKPITITLDISVDGDCHWLSMSNPLRPKQGVITTGKGLTNLTTRYQLLCEHNIKIHKTADIFTVMVPLIS